MRSEPDLRAAALRAAPGYEERPRDLFTNLIYILDRELRLITPTDPEGSDEDRGGARPAGRCYQLTHDYLVPSLRDWLTRKQKETRKGRAELRLAERSSLWNAKSEDRHLPSLLEWANIRWLTSEHEWLERERRMMRRAGRIHGVRGSITLALLTLVGIVGFGVWHRVDENQRATHAAGLVKRLLDPDVAQILGVVGDMREYRRWVDPLLRNELAKSPDGSVPTDSRATGFASRRYQSSGAAHRPTACRRTPRGAGPPGNAEIPRRSRGFAKAMVGSGSRQAW